MTHTTSGIQVGDRVDTGSDGLGIVRCVELGTVLVQHDTSKPHLHDGNGLGPVLPHHTGWWYPPEELKPAAPPVGASKPAYQGHPMFRALTEQELKLHDEKNHDYACGGDPLGNFKRVAKFLSQYPGLDLADPAIVAMVYAMKQVDAYLWMKSNGHTAKVEGGARRLQDVSVYAKLTQILEAEGGETVPVP